MSVQRLLREGEPPTPYDPSNDVFFVSTPTPKRAWARDAGPSRLERVPGARGTPTNDLGGRGPMTPGPTPAHKLAVTRSGAERVEHLRRRLAERQQKAAFHLETRPDVVEATILTPESPVISPSNITPIITPERMEQIHLAPWSHPLIKATPITQPTVQATPIQTPPCGSTSGHGLQSDDQTGPVFTVPHSVDRTCVGPIFTVPPHTSSDFASR